jgi:hypothetical protein
MRTDCFENLWNRKLELILGNCLETELRLSNRDLGIMNKERLGYPMVWVNTIGCVYSWYVQITRKEINENVKKRKRKWEKHKNRKKRKRKDGEHKSTGNKSWMGAFELVSQIRRIKRIFAHVNTRGPQLSDLSLFQAWGGKKGNLHTRG